MVTVMFFPCFFFPLCVSSDTEKTFNLVKKKKKKALQFEVMLIFLKSYFINDLVMQ